MTSVETVTIDSLVDKQLVLSNSQWAGKLSDSLFGGWTSLRLVWRYSIDDSGAAISGTPRMYVGLMSNPVEGMTNGPLGNSTSHFVGVRTALSTWTRSAGPPVQYDNSAVGGWEIMKRNGSTDVVGSTANAFAPGRFFYADGQSLRNVNVLEITKGSPFSMSSIFCGLAFTEVDVPLETLLALGGSNKSLATVASELNAYVDGVSPDTETTYASVLGPRTVSVDEGTNGELNAVVFAWNQVAPAMRISEVLIVKMA